MTWGEYLSDRFGALLLHLIGMAALSVFLLATGTQSGVLVIVLLTWLLCLCALQATSFFRLRAHLWELESIMDSLDQKHLFAECAPKPGGAYERHLFELLRRAGRAMIGTASEAQAAQREYRVYVESWVHEIKTPITAAQLICRNAHESVRRKLLPELAQIENHVERALFYARAESPEQDFIIRRVRLSDVVSQAVAHHRALLMQNGVCVELSALDRMVYTDEKWAVFLLGQLLQNAARYRRGENARVCISARTLGMQEQLTVFDNGIGIPEHELSRIFERGFTGHNGRSFGAATGMGLYLCRRLANFLQIDIRTRSTVGEGTDFTLTFPARENLSKP